MGGTDAFRSELISVGIWQAKPGEVTQKAPRPDLDFIFDGFIELAQKHQFVTSVMGAGGGMGGFKFIPQTHYLPLASSEIRSFIRERMRCTGHQAEFVERCFDAMDAEWLKIVREKLKPKGMTGSASEEASDEDG